MKWLISVVKLLENLVINSLKRNKFNENRNLRSSSELKKYPKFIIDFLKNIKYNIIGYQNCVEIGGNINRNMHFKEQVFA